MNLALFQDEKNPACCAVRFSDDEPFYHLALLLRAGGDAAGDVAGDDMPPEILQATPLSVASQAAQWMPRLHYARQMAQTRGALSAARIAAGTPLCAPVPRPNRILAIGRNYAEHARESGAEPLPEPIVFLKASTSVIGPEQAIQVPENIGQIDHEGELLVVLGQGGRRVSEQQAMQLVCGYTLFNDVTARTLQRADQARKHPWFRSKSLDTFGPMGPWLTTADAISDPHDLPLTVRVNGSVRQADSTAAMLHTIPRLISYLSFLFALEPGDVIATGTPAGVGPLTPGDTVEVTMDSLGTLRNPVEAALPLSEIGSS